MCGDVLMGLDAGALSAFFRAFFMLPPQQWHAFLSRTNSTHGDSAAPALIVPVETSVMEILDVLRSKH